MPPAGPDRIEAGPDRIEAGPDRVHHAGLHEWRGSGYDPERAWCGVAPWDPRPGVTAG